MSTIEKKEQRDMNQHATDKNVAGVEWIIHATLATLATLCVLDD